MNVDQAMKDALQMSNQAVREALPRNPTWWQKLPPPEEQLPDINSLWKKLTLRQLQALAARPDVGPEKAMAFVQEMMAREARGG